MGVGDETVGPLSRKGPQGRSPWWITMGLILAPWAVVALVVLLLGLSG